jgi:XTP/dITP diphosphohydrolase
MTSTRRGIAAGCVVVLLDQRLGPHVPAAAIPALRAATAVFAEVDVLASIVDAVGGQPLPPPPVDLVGLSIEHGPALVLFTNRMTKLAETWVAEGATVVRAQQPGSGLLEAVSVMDRLRSPGGCPWDAEQTHESLRQYLVEECFELLEAIDDGDRAALREELGDVLLQVLFHARIAEEDAADPFSVDEVAADLVGKLTSRHPHVFGGGDPAVSDATSQERRWEELKQEEKRRESSVDGVAFGQPALALAAKLAKRTARAGLPGELLPGEDGVGARLFELAALSAVAGADPEGELRVVARRFASQVRQAEQAARDAGVDPATLDHDGWRRFWPAGGEQ